MLLPKAAVKAIIKNNKGELLLLKNKKGDWDLPGGLVESGEQDHIALLRELKEELGPATFVMESALASGNLQELKLIAW